MLFDSLQLLIKLKSFCPTWSGDRHIMIHEFEMPCKLHFAGFKLLYAKWFSRSSFYRFTFFFLILCMWNYYAIPRFVKNWTNEKVKWWFYMNRNKKTSLDEKKGQCKNHYPITYYTKLFCMGFVSCVVIHLNFLKTFDGFYLYEWSVDCQNKGVFGKGWNLSLCQMFIFPFLMIGEDLLWTFVTL